MSFNASLPLTAPYSTWESPLGAWGLAVLLLFAACGGGGNHATVPTPPAQQPGLYLLAGQPGGRGSLDGTGSGARFNDPFQLVTDTAGNAYVTDTYNNEIRKITPVGVTTTLAGVAGYPGMEDGQGSAAHFNGPAGIAVDAAGAIYVADSGSHTIRKITATGLVSTWVGQAGYPGGTDGSGKSARFNSPQGLAIDGMGNVYVADANSHTIRKITPGGVVSTLAGLAGQAGSTDGTGSAAAFFNPIGVCVDTTGTVLVADTGNHTIRKITPTGVVSTWAGLAGSAGSTDGAASAARFHFPFGVGVDGAGTVLVADTYNHRIRKITPAGVVSTLAGPTGVSASTSFNYPTGVACDGSGNALVVDSSNQLIRKIAVDGSVSSLAGLAPVPGSADGSGSAARFNLPTGVAVNATGSVFVTDGNNHTLRKLTPAGMVSTLAGLAGASGSADGTGNAARFNTPSGVAVDAAGNVYVADTSNQTLRKISPAGAVSTLAGQAGNPGSADGTGNQARFRNPLGVAVDGAGNVYVADSDNNTIRKVTPAGVVTTLAGLAGTSGSADGTGSQARFCYPMGVAVDVAGNVFVTDSENSTIRKITSAGVVTTLAGDAGADDFGRGSTDGPGKSARFYSPSGLALDGSGNLIVLDTVNGTLRKITPDGVTTTVMGLALQAGVRLGADPRLGWGWGLARAGSNRFVLSGFEENVVLTAILH